MSTLEKRQEAPRTEVRLVTLREEIESLGIAVPDQTHAQRVMDAARIDLPVTASAKQIRRAWLRRLLSSNWRVFSWKGYEAADHALWGGRAPAFARDMHAKISAAIPEAAHEIHAKVSDPFHVVRCPRRGETVILSGWQLAARIL